MTLDLVIQFYQLEDEDMRMDINGLKVQILGSTETICDEIWFMILKIDYAFVSTSIPLNQSTNKSSSVNKYSNCVVWYT
jgi:L-2-hydroxyglutarate oxidase LhgO